MHRSVEMEAAPERLHKHDAGEKEGERMGQSERKRGRRCEEGHEEIRALAEWLTYNFKIIFYALNLCLK